MPINKSLLLSELLNNFLKLYDSIEAIIVSDEDGLMIAGEKRKAINMKIISVLTAIVNPIYERIRDEFTFKKYGTVSFDTDEHRLLFISIDNKITLSLIVNVISNIEKIAPYGYLLAEKVSLILNAEDDINISLSFDTFEDKPLNLLEERETRETYILKIILIGDHNVGKTSIIRRFVENKFSYDYRATLGLNILTQDIIVSGNNINLILWDIGAQKFFKRYRKSYYKDAQAAFIVFDLTNSQSFNNIKYWFNELKEFIENKHLPIIIVGNKRDLNEQRVIDFQEGVKLADDLSQLDFFSSASHISRSSNMSVNVESKISYLEVSALSGDNIRDAFTLISFNFIKKIKKNEEIRIKNEILNDINLILDHFNSLKLTFISEDLLWSPCLQTLNEIKELGEFSKIKDKSKEVEFKYSNGLTLKNYTFDTFKISDSDGVYCIFDARDKKHIDPEWKKIVLQILKKIKKNKIILVGMRVSENSDLSQLIEEFDINEIAKEKEVSLLFFKIGMEDRVEIYNQIKVMVNTIKNLCFNY